jgi:hypothetical protein
MNMKMSDFKLPQEVRGTLFIMEPLKYTTAMGSAILNHGSTAVKRAKLGGWPWLRSLTSSKEDKVASESLRSNYHASFLSHIQILEVILQGHASDKTLGQIHSILASAPDPITGESYPGEMALAYGSYVGFANVDRLEGWLWLPAALAQSAIAESSSSSSSMKQSLRGIGAVAEEELR